MKKEYTETDIVNDTNEMMEKFFIDGLKISYIRDYIEQEYEGNTDSILKQLLLLKTFVNYLEGCTDRFLRIILEQNGEDISISKYLKKHKKEIDILLKEFMSQPERKVRLNNAMEKYQIVEYFFL